MALSNIYKQSWETKILKIFLACFLIWMNLIVITNCFVKTSEGISIDLFRQKTPREQMYNAPDLNKYGIHFNSIFKKHTNRTNDSIALYRYLDNDFYGKIVVGHPGQGMNVAFDTAWSLTWLISSQCNGFKDFGCWFHSKYDHTRSSYYKPNGTTFISNEGKYNFTGFYSYENISIAHSNVTGFSFVEMTSVPFSFLFNKADGVLGLGLRDEYGSYNPFFYTLLKQGKINKPIFSIFLNRDPSSNKGGNIMLGFYDKKYIHMTVYPNKSIIPDEITYLNVDPGQLWQFEVDKITVSKDLLKNITVCPNGCKGIIDSSSNRIEGPADEIQKIHTEIKAQAFYFNKWRVDCDTVTSLPKIYVTLGGKDFRMSPKDYIIKMSYLSVTLCLSAFSPITTPGYESNWLFGGAFLTPVYTIYDISEKKIGFVRAAGH